MLTLSKQPTSRRTDALGLLSLIILTFVALGWFLSGSVKDHMALQGDRKLTAEQCVADGGEAVENGNRVSCLRADGTWRQLAAS